MFFMVPNTNDLSVSSTMTQNNPPPKKNNCKRVNKISMPKNLIWRDQIHTYEENLNIRKPNKELTNK